MSYASAGVRNVGRRLQRPLRARQARPYKGRCGVFQLLLINLPFIFPMINHIQHFGRGFEFFLQPR